MRFTLILFSLLIALLPALYYYAPAFFDNPTIVCTSKDDLSRLLRIDVNKMRITEVRSKILVKDGFSLLSIVADELSSDIAQQLFSNDRHAKDAEYDLIPPFYSNILSNMGFELKDIEKYGYVFGDMETRKWMIPYDIRWYYANDHLVILTLIPGKIIVPNWIFW